jgi:Glycine rich protein
MAALAGAAPAAAGVSLCGSAGTYSVSGSTASCTYTAAAEDTFAGATLTGVEVVDVLAIGAPGGAASYGPAGGTGARVAAVLPLSGSLYVEVGGAGQSGDDGGAGGFNGGGSYSGPGGPGGGGGGASDVRTMPSADAGSLASRLVVAAGGGGAASGESSPVPVGGSGAAGSLETGPPLVADGGDGVGSETSAGSGGTGSGGGTAGSGLCGGAGAGTLGTGGGGVCHGGGGGGGYYGGGGGDNQNPNAGAGGAGSSMGPAGTVFETASASDTPEVVISWEVSAPIATITSPAAAALYALDSRVPTAFTCAEGTGGPGISSCSDSNGGHGSAGTLDTSAAGIHSYTVTATSADGETGKATISYVVAAAPSVAIQAPVQGTSYAQGKSLSAEYTCADGPFGPGIKTCTATPVDASIPGAHVFTAIATSQDGQTTSRSVTYTVVGKPSLRAVHQSAKVWRTAHGTRFSFTLNQSAQVTLTFRAGTGNRARTVGTLSVSGHSGTNSVSFRGRLKHTKLKPGGYSVTISARSLGGTTTAKPLHFTIAS